MHLRKFEFYLQFLQHINKFLISKDIYFKNKRRSLVATRSWLDKLNPSVGNGTYERPYVVRNEVKSV